MSASDPVPTPVPTPDAPTSHVTAEQVAAARHDPKLANVLYHDWEAPSYERKWSISYDQRCIDYVVGRFRTVTGQSVRRYAHALEIGCGTGFFLLNLMQAGLVRRGSLTDLSPGMVRAALDNAYRLALDVQGQVADGERLPYPANSFDLVVGHAVLHHIPDVPAALREVLRVLRPGGCFVFAGEPSRIGDRYARALGRGTWWVTTRLTRLPGLRRFGHPQRELHESSHAAMLEAVVDLHTFDPAELEAVAVGAGAVRVRVRTEEFAAAVVGWTVRTFEAAVAPERLGVRWANFAYRTWLLLSALDARVVSRVLPRSFGYNVLLSGHKPDTRTGACD